MGEKNGQVHKSFGIIGISRITGHDMSLFGSQVKHRQAIRLTIKAARVEREYHLDRYFSKGLPIVEICLSAAQFAELITTASLGEGVPCTIQSIQGERFDPPPYRGQGQAFNSDLQKAVNEAFQEADDLIARAEELINQKGPLKVAGKKELADAMKRMATHVKNNMPFIQEQLSDAMDKTVTTAKAEIEAFYASSVRKAGVRAIGDFQNGPISPRLGQDGK